jgi:hypothetical protein
MMTTHLGISFSLSLFLDSYMNYIYIAFSSHQGDDTMSRYMQPIYQILMMRMRMLPTMKYANGLVLFLSQLVGQQRMKQQQPQLQNQSVNNGINALSVIQGLESLGTGVFYMFLLDVWLPASLKIDPGIIPVPLLFFFFFLRSSFSFLFSFFFFFSMTGHFQRKIVAVGLISLLFDDAIISDAIGENRIPKILAQIASSNGGAAAAAPNMDPIFIRILTALLDLFQLENINGNTLSSSILFL